VLKAQEGKLSSVKAKELELLLISFVEKVCDGIGGCGEDGKWKKEM
jgi:hypothetical protein